MTRVTDEHIDAFMAEHECSLVEVVRTPDARGKAVIYVKYACKCNDGITYGKKWKEFMKIPMCGGCSRKANPRVSDEVIKKQVEANGCEFISAEHVTVDKSRIFITYICSCDIATTRVHKRSQWEVVKRGCGCNVCGDEHRRDTNKATYALHGDEIMNKIKITMMAKYGVEHATQHPDVKNKIIATSLERYGVTNPANCEQGREKSRKTMNERYGVDYAMQNSEIREKQITAAFKTKQYTFPSGRVAQVQGYEPLALDILLRTHDENDIITDGDLAFTHEFWYDYDGMRHRYFPDILVISEQKIIEVKSDYTLNYDPVVLELKMESVFTAGCDMELWTFDNKGNLYIQ